MKRRLWKRIAAAFICCMTMLTALPVMAATAVEPGDWSKVTEDYYTEANGFKFSGGPSITIKKLDPVIKKPIMDVKFTTKKIGDLYQVKDGNEYVMVYGLDPDFATALDITKSADYIKVDNEKVVLYGYKDLSSVNRAAYDIGNGTEGTGATEDAKEALKTYLRSGSVVTTGDDGKAVVTLDSTNKYGLYVVMETDVTEAKFADGKWASITRQEIPYVVALPTYGETTGWDNTVEVETKNNTSTAEIEKKIVTNYYGTGELLTGSGVRLDDTDITFMTDVVEFKLSSTVPVIPNKYDSENITQYVITDKLSEGFSLNNNFTDSSNIMIKTKQGADGDEILLESTNYLIEIKKLGNAENEYSNGTKIIITFNEAGKKKLTELSKAASEDEKIQNIYVYYKATVNEKAIIGPNNINNRFVGNPNEVMLTYQVGTSHEIETDWDKVTHYLFEIDAQKTLEGGSLDGKEESVEFILYSEKNGVKTYYQFTEGKNTPGIYYLSGAKTKEDEATPVSPKGDSDTLKLLGLEGYDESDDKEDNVTYYLKEIKTVSGYNLLKEPIAIKLTPSKIDKHQYTGTDAQYNGVLTTDGDDDGITSLKVINTKGFQLPSTGGMGIGLFVLAGAAVVAAGIIYYVSSGKKEKKC